MNQPGSPTASTAIPLWPGLAVTTLVGLVYLAVASEGTFRFRQSAFPHHVLIADAWLHGQLNVRDEVIAKRNEEFYRAYRAELERRQLLLGPPLTEAQWQQIRAQVTPPTVHDLAQVGGKYYGVWGPMVPAVLLPYVAWRGLEASDMLFSCVVAMGTVCLTFLMLRRAHLVGFVPVTPPACTALALLMGLGTIHFYISVLGQVWHLSQIVAVFFVTLAIWCVLHCRDGTVWALAGGAAFGAGVLTRGSEWTLVPFFYAALFATRRQVSLPAARSAIAFTVPLFIAGGLALAFNYARFGSIFDGGDNIMTGSNPMFRQEYLQYGAFNLRYVPRNIYYYFLNWTLVRDNATGSLTFDPWGNSMFMVTPALLYVFRAWRSDWFTRGVWCGIGGCMTLLLLLQFTGWYTFGTRYMLDFMPLAIVLVAIGMRGRLTWVSLTLIALSLVVNAWGTYRFCSEQL